MALIHKQGDLFGTDARILVHGVNSLGDMGGGIAYHIAQKYGNDLVDRYQEFCLNALPGEVMYYFTPEGKVIANAVTQVLPGADARLSLIKKSLADIALAWQGETIAMPRIGCGIGGLTWEQVEPVLQWVHDRYFTLGADLEVWTL